MSDLDWYDGPERAVSIWLGEVDRRMIAQADAEELQAMEATRAVAMAEEHNREVVLTLGGEALMAAVRCVIAEERSGAWD